MGGTSDAGPAERPGEFLLRALAVACKRERTALGADTPLAALDLDSLSLIAVLSQVETVYAIRLTDAERGALLQARVVGELVAVVENAAC